MPDCAKCASDKVTVLYPRGGGDGADQISGGSGVDAIFGDAGVERADLPRPMPYVTF